MRPLPDIEGFSSPILFYPSNHCRVKTFYLLPSTPCAQSATNCSGSGGICCFRSTSARTSGCGWKNSGRAAGSLDFYFFRVDTVREALLRNGFAVKEVRLRDPYAGVEYESRRAYVFGEKK